MLLSQINDMVLSIINLRCRFFERSGNEDTPPTASGLKYK